MPDLMSSLNALLRPLDGLDAEIFYNLSQLLQLPTLLIINILFLYALFELGRFGAHWGLRHKNKEHITEALNANGTRRVKGYPLVSQLHDKPSSTMSDIEVSAFKEVEMVRLVTRIAPMLGLVATLIPMGPALVSMANNDFVEMSELLRSAFTAVVLALVAASITYWIASVKKRWLAEEMLLIERQLSASSETAS